MATEAVELAIVPALNEEATISSIVSALRANGHDVVVIDDGSTDRTAELADHSGAFVLSLPINLGVGGALRAGFRFAIENGYRSVVQVDADGQHPIDQIVSLRRAAAQHDAHLVIGSRYLSPSSTLVPSVPRRISMSILARIASQIARKRLTDTTSGFRIIREPLLSAFAETFPDYYLGDTFEATVAAARAGYRVIETPAALAPRAHGQSSASTPQAVRLIAKVLLITMFRLHPEIRRFS